MLRYPCGPPSHRHQISGSCSAGRAKQGRPGVGEPERPLRGPARDIAPGAGHRPDDRPAGARLCGRPPAEPAEDHLAERQQQRPAATVRGIEQQRAAFVVVTLAGRAQSLVGKRRGAVGHRAQPLPGGRVQRAVASLGLDGREQPEFGDEALVVRGKLAADARRERVAVQLVFEQARGLLPPARAFRETTGRRSWPRAAPPPRRSRGCWPTSPGCGTRRGTAGASGSAVPRVRCARKGQVRPATRPAGAGSRPG